MRPKLILDSEHQVDLLSKPVEEAGIGIALPWQCIYTFSRFEKKICLRLEKMGVEAYLPVQTVIRKWSDRKKKVDLPLFPGYIFLRTPTDRHQNVLEISGVVRFLGDGQGFANVPHAQIEMIRRLLENAPDPVAHSEFVEGERVQVIFGPLAGMEGIVWRWQGKNRLVLNLEAIGQAVSVSINPNYLIKKV